MVRMRPRGAAPARLQSKKRTWTDRWTSICAGSHRGNWLTPSARKILAEALSPLTHGKCAFCESRLGVTSYLEIEHYVCKTRDVALAFEWTNLFPACRLCNSAKGDQDHQNLLIKPDEEDPEPFFWVHPDSGKLEPHPSLTVDQQRRALETIRILNLQRGPLCVKRIKMIEDVGHWLTGHLKVDWGHFVDPTTEYKLVLRHVLRLRGAGHLADQDKQVFEIV